MGVLVAKAYPTKLFLNAADHTYVECETGAVGWSCWGGKSGGAAINSGTGSTEQANKIAQPDERAGITCYLINGVCHQAANRVLFPAKKLVTTARGYFVSSGIFGPYGRTGRWLCQAPFNTFAGQTGDLSKCLAHLQVQQADAIASASDPDQEKRDSSYFEAIAAAYQNVAPIVSNEPDLSKTFVRRLYDIDISYRLGEDLARGVRPGLLHAKSTIEDHWEPLADAFSAKTLSPVDYIKEFNALTTAYQDDVGNALDEEMYLRFIGLPRDERIVLADPEIVAAAYGSDIARQVYPNLGRNGFAP